MSEFVPIPINKRPIKTSKRPDIQSLVVNEKTKLKADFEGARITQKGINVLARNTVARALKTQRLRKEKNILEQQSLVDNKTILLSELGFEKSLEKAIRNARREEGRKLGVVYLDLRGFKPVNDRLGEKNGDLVLTAVGRYLSNLIRASDFAARPHGDEFTICVAGSKDTGESNVQGLASRIAELNEKDIPEAIIRDMKERGIDMEDMRVQMHIGYAELQDGETGESLIHRASLEMNKQKKGNPTDR